MPGIRPHAPHRSRLANQRGGPVGAVLGRAVRPSRAALLKRPIPDLQFEAGDPGGGWRRPGAGLMPASACQLVSPSPDQEESWSGRCRRIAPLWRGRRPRFEQHRDDSREFPLCFAGTWATTVREDEAGGHSGADERHRPRRPACANPEPCRQRDQVIPPPMKREADVGLLGHVLGASTRWMTPVRARATAAARLMV